MTNCTDGLGQQLHVGDIISYPGRSGSSMWLNFAVITGLSKKEDWRNNTYWEIEAMRASQNWRGDVIRTRKVKIVCTERVVVPRLDIMNQTSPVVNALLQLKGDMVLHPNTF